MQGFLSSARRAGSDGASCQDAEEVEKLFCHLRAAQEWMAR
ncbi:hypothetical protein A2U01_0104124, partial [Trifolium medium]|nr:hypothetical protein [Trifolium medium]